MPHLRKFQRLRRRTRTHHIGSVLKRSTPKTRLPQPYPAISCTSLLIPTPQRQKSQTHAYHNPSTAFPAGSRHAEGVRYPNRMPGVPNRHLHFARLSRIRTNKGCVRHLRKSAQLRRRTHPTRIGSALSPRPAHDCARLPTPSCYILHIPVNPSRQQHSPRHRSSLHIRKRLVYLCQRAHLRYQLVQFQPALLVERQQPLEVMARTTRARRATN